jgi:hypothetical protein
MGVVVIGGGGSGGGGNQNKAQQADGEARVIAIDGTVVATFTSLKDAEDYAAMLNIEAASPEG